MERNDLEIRVMLCNWKTGRITTAHAVAPLKDLKKISPEEFVERWTKPATLIALKEANSRKPIKVRIPDFEISSIFRG